MPHINDVLFGNQLKTNIGKTTKHLYDTYSIGLLLALPLTPDIFVVVSAG